MPKTSEPGKLPTVEMDEWLNTNGLAHHTRSNRSCFHRMAGLPIIGQAAASTIGCEGDSCFISGSIFDHPRRFRIKGRNKLTDFAGVVSAPYLHVHEMTAKAEQICDEFDLSFRIGDPRDDWYGYGTTPLIIWNPRIVSL
ncbi:hypothetical protein [Pseudarthrobacter sp. AB1]|uniref:hypothetical protein n=1 Tax=Pseudarthrobacter sp. AB1 TaxID=2138309 RepID=UPI00186BA3C5|nr:hypothetical protein [Pseudarthrobacter sp. AB1]MBE4719518.1 hypothetical protein [Pseudarthrobacter sp. AB1]